MIVRFAIYIAIAVGSGVGAQKLPLNVSYSDYKAAADLLFNISGMVFTIMGIWIAFLYPNALSRLANPNKVKTADFSETLDETRRLEAIVGSILTSGFVAVCVLLIAIAASVVNGLPADLRPGSLRPFGVGVLMFLILIQLDAVGNVLLANIAFLNDIHRKREARQQEENL